MGEQGGLSRRDVLELGGATGTLTAMAGCLGWLRGGGDDETSDEGAERDQDQDETEQPEDGNESTNETNTTEETDSGGDTNESGNETQDENDTGGDGNESESANETGEEERQKEPSEEDTEINEEKYNETEEREVEERPESDVEIPRDSVEASQGSDGTITVTGKLTNVSDEDIDFVDVEVNYVGETGSVIGMDLVVVRGIAAGATETFESRMGPTELDGEVDSVRFTCYPQDYA